MNPHAIVTTVLVAIAFAAGRWSVPTPAPQPPTGGVQAAQPLGQPAAPVPAATSAPKAVTQSPAVCESQLAIATKLLEAQHRQANGTPVPFPADLAPPYTPAGFETAVEDALAACDSPLSIAHVDCLEFPCMVFFDQPEGSRNHAVAELAGCAEWGRRFAGGGRSNSHFMTDDGPVEYSTAAPRPSGTLFDDNATTRWKNRLEAGRLELMSARGGREYTKRESLEGKLIFWEENGHDEMAATIRAQIEALED